MMKSKQVMSGIFLVIAVFAIVPALEASTVAYWRFEEGVKDNAVPDCGGRTSYTPGSYMTDSSGNGNHLLSWDNIVALCYYRDDVAENAIPGYQDASNALSIQNGASLPGCITWSDQTNPSGINLDTMTPTQWTVEVSVKLTDVSGYRTFVGRDGRDVAAADINYAPLYLQKDSGNHARIVFVDAAGNVWIAAENGTMVTGQWYHFAAVCDGTTLKLYKNTVGHYSGYNLVASTDISSSANSALAFAGNVIEGGPFGWAVGRGMWGCDGHADSGHADRCLGYIDEVRISNTALAPSAFLQYNTEPAAYWRFEEGPADTAVSHAGADGDFDGQLLDSSGNGHPLSVGTANDAVYRADAPSTVLLQNVGVNNFSLENVSNSPQLVTDINDPLNDVTWNKWTIEVCFKADSLSGHRTFLGREGRDLTSVAGEDPATAPLYFKASSGGDSKPHIEFIDQDGVIQSVTSSNTIVTGHWYQTVAVSDGSTLKLYLNDLAAGRGPILVGSLDMGTGNHAMKAGADDNDRWIIFRSMFNGNPADFFYGKIDEVRITPAALEPNAFLYPPPPQGTLIIIQ